MILFWEAKGANQSDTLILGSGETVADYDGASDKGVNSRFEDIRSTPPGGRARRLRKSNWSHRFDFEHTRQDMHTSISSGIWRMSFLGKTRESKRKLDSNERNTLQWHGPNSFFFFSFFGTKQGSFVSRNWQVGNYATRVFCNKNSRERETKRLRPTGRKPSLFLSCGFRFLFTFGQEKKISIHLYENVWTKKKYENE